MDTKQKFLIAYCDRFCSIELLYGTNSPLKCQYDMALLRRGMMFGDIVSYNNQYWGIVEANNAKDALDIFMKKDWTRNEV